MRYIKRSDKTVEMRDRGRVIFINNFVFLVSDEISP